jgi:formyl-CoA transferase
MTAIGRIELANDPQLASNSGRVSRTDELDRVIGEWTASHDLEQVLAVLERAEVPAGKIYDIADIVNDVHYRARKMIVDLPLEKDRSLKVPGIVPKLSDTPGATRWLGPKLGAHTAEVLKAIGYDETRISALEQSGVIATRN